MKRKISFLLLIVFVLSFAACNQQEENYTYNYISETYPRKVNLSTYRSLPLESGALLMLHPYILHGDIYVSGDSTPFLNCLFSEESKTLIPLCFSVTCSHDTNECFANEVYKRDYNFNRGIYKDKVFTTRTETETSNGERRSYIIVEYYTLDGTLVDSIKYKPELIMSDGNIALTYQTKSTFLRYDGKRYYHVERAADFNVPYNERYYENWVVCHDLETNSFVSYSLPRNKEGTSFSLVDVSETSLGCKTTDGKGYVLDFETGEVTEYDCGEILDRMVSEGRLMRGFEIIDVNALKDYFVLTMGSGRMYVKISTETGFIPPPEEEYALVDCLWRFDYNGDTYFLGETLDGNRQEYISLLTGEKFTVADRERYYMIYSETENGLILEYVNILPDGSREPTFENKTEGGREVQYTFPKKLAYVTKEDFIDGSVDEPWFFDYETYSFVQP